MLHQGYHSCFLIIGTSNYWALRPRFHYQRLEHLTKKQHQTFGHTVPTLHTSAATLLLDSEKSWHVVEVPRLLTGTFYFV